MESIGIPKFLLQASHSHKVYEFDQHMADMKTEVHFIGQIVGGRGFNIQEEIFCECAIEAGKEWYLNSNIGNIEIQTHASSSEVALITNSRMMRWLSGLTPSTSTTQPTPSPNGRPILILHRPRMIMRVWRVESSGNLEIGIPTVTIIIPSGIWHLLLPQQGWLL